MFPPKKKKGTSASSAVPSPFIKDVAAPGAKSSTPYAKKSPQARAMHGLHRAAGMGSGKR